MDLFDNKFIEFYVVFFYKKKKNIEKGYNGVKFSVCKYNIIKECNWIYLSNIKYYVYLKIDI